jgi:porin
MAVAASARAQDPAEETPPPPQGLMPVPNYNLDLASRAYLSGDWGGARSTLADKGIQLTVDWNQYLQGVVDGGLDRTTQYGGALDYVVDLDLMRMGVLDGALINIRVESRYGNSVNGQSGSILPVNTDAFFPLTDSLDEDVAFAITDLKYTQFLSPNLAVLLGKADTLSGDPNEFASGRGTTQFMNANFLFNSVTALRMPYSTLAAATSRASRRSTTSPSRRQPMSVSTHNSSSRWRAALTQPFSSACASS